MKEINLEYTICTDCDNKIKTDEAYIVNGVLLCDKCANNYEFCDSCGKVYNKNEMLRQGNEYICDECLDSKYVKCEYCGDSIKTDEATIYSNNTCLCNDCFSEAYIICSDCGNVFHFTECHIEDGKEYCNECYSKR